MVLCTPNFPLIYGYLIQCGHLSKSITSSISLLRLLNIEMPPLWTIILCGQILMQISVSGKNCNMNAAFGYTKALQYGEF